MPLLTHSRQCSCPPSSAFHGHGTGVGRACRRCEHPPPWPHASAARVRWGREANSEQDYRRPVYGGGNNNSSAMTLSPLTCNDFDSTPVRELRCSAVANDPFVGRRHRRRDGVFDLDQRLYIGSTSVYNPRCTKGGHKGCRHIVCTPTLARGLNVNRRD